MDADPPPPALSYVPPPPGATRGQFRLLLLLTFVNTLLLGTYVLGPGLSGLFRQQWADYQQRRADHSAAAAVAAARVAYLPAQQQCLDYAAPADTLIYAEDPVGVRRLASAGTVNRAASQRLPDLPLPLQWMPPVAVTDPWCAAAMPANLGLRDTDGGTLFLHGRQAAPAATLRLVLVTVRGVQTAEKSYTVSEGRRNYGVSTVRTLTGRLLRPATAAADAEVADETTLDLVDDRLTLVTETTSESSGGPTYRIDYAGQLRLYAGQPDPLDPSRFTIPYDLDGTRGTVVGHLVPGDHLSLTVNGPLAAAALVTGSPAVPSPDERAATGQPR